MTKTSLEKLLFKRQYVLQNNGSYEKGFTYVKTKPFTIIGHKIPNNKPYQVQDETLEEIESILINMEKL